MVDMIKIGGLFYEVRTDSKLSRDHSANGNSCGNDLYITIDDSLASGVQETTLVHEVIEQINHVYNIELDHAQICLLEAGFYQVMKDNKNVFDFK